MGFVDYEHNLLQVMAAIRNKVGCSSSYEEDPLVKQFLSSKEQVITLLIDGMGSRLVERMLPKDSFLRTHLLEEVDTVYPTTTGAATITVATGKAPNENGWLGWTQYYPELDDIIVNFYGKGYYSSKEYGSDWALKHVPYLNMVDELEAKGIHAKEIYPAFRPDGCATFKEMVTRIIQASKNQEQRYLYCYWDAFDSLMHKVGPNADEAKTMLLEINAELEAMTSQLDPKTGIIVLADHGQIDNVQHNLFEDKELVATFRHKPSCEQRTVVFWIQPDALETFRDAFEKRYADSFALMPSDEVVREKIFGPKQDHPRFREFIGDFVAFAKTPLSLGYNEDGPLFIMKGSHAGSCVDEVKIPVIGIEKNE